MTRLAAVTALALALLLPSHTVAAERASTKEAEAMVRSAVDYFKTNGKEKSLAAFSDPKGQFTYRDIYVFVLDLNGIVRAHGAKPEIIGRNDLNAKDSTGKMWNHELLQTAKTAGKGWVEYRFKNPVSNQEERKVTYFEKVGDLVIGCGVFLGA